jgi:hypothetical protein
MAVANNLAYHKMATIAAVKSFIVQGPVLQTCCMTIVMSDPHFSWSKNDDSRSSIDDSRSINDDSRSINDDSRSINDDSRSINDDSRSIIDDS